MQNNIDEPLNSPTGDLAIVGDNAGSGYPVSMQLIQSIYNELTGKSEQIEQGFSIPYQITIDDLQQLDSKIQQMQEPLTVCSKNCRVTVYYYKDTKEAFSSFERFKLIDKSRLSPVNSVVLKYNFVIKLPKTDRLQNYSISIRLGSKITALKELKEDVPEELEVPFFVFERNAVASIDYVDYIVARNFLDSVKDWIHGLPENSHPKTLVFLRKKAHYLPRITKYGVGFFVLWLILGKAHLYLPTGSADIGRLAQFLLISFGLVFITYNFASWLGVVSKNGLRSIHEISYVKLNRGDELEIERAQRENKIAKIKAVVGFIVTIVISIITKIIAAYLVH